MKYRILLVIPAVVIFAACQPSREELIAKKWQLQSIYTESVAHTIDQQLHYIDTLGTHDTATLAKMGITDLPTYKAQLKAQVDAYQADQAKVVKNTSYDFQKQGAVYINSVGGTDTADWHFKGDKTLVIVRKKQNRTTESTIDLLTKDSLKITLVKDGMPSTAIFTPAKS